MADIMMRNQIKLILFVDDDPDLRELGQMLLETQEDLVVISARDGQRALRLLDVIEPDLIVTDLMMPVLDGFGFLRAYKTRPETVPVIAMSAFEPYLEQALQLNADAILPKPFESVRLIKLVRQLLAGQKPAEPLPSPPPRGEDERLRAILDLRLDQPAPEPDLQRFVDEVAAYFEVPVALFSIVTHDRQFWTAGCGIPEDLAASRGTPRQESFCTHSVVARAALIVQDTLENPFFRDNVLVATRGLRFYAGVPLIRRHGEALGTLCILDFKARHFTHKDLELLSVFGRRVLAALEWRERAMSPDIPPGAFQHLEYVDQELGIFSASGFRELAVVEAARGTEADIPVACVALAVPLRRLREATDLLRSRHPRSLIGRLGHARLGWLVPGIAATEAHEEALATAGPHAFAEAADLSGYPGTAVVASLDALAQALGDAGLA